MSTPRPNLLPVLIGGLVSIGLGFLFGWTMKPSSSNQADQQGVGQSSKTQQTQSLSSLTIGQGASSGQLSKSFFQNWESKDLSKMAQLALNANNRTENELWLKVLVAVWAQKDMKQALDFAQEANRPDLLRAALMQSTAATMESSMQWIDEQDLLGGQKRYLKMSLFRGLAASDPAFAMEQASQIADPTLQEELKAVSLDEWAVADSSAVYQWMETQELTPILVETYRNLMQKEIEKNPEEGASLVNSLQSSELKNNLLESVGRLWAQKDPQKVIDWIQGKEGKEKYSALVGLVEGWTKNKDGEKAVDYLMNESRSMDSYESVFRAAAINLAFDRPEVLLDRFQGMNESEQLVTAEYVATSFGMNSPERAEPWINTMPNGAAKDKGLDVLSSQFARNKPEKAFEFASSIDDRSLRLRALSTLVESAGRYNPPEMEQWISQSGLLGEEDKSLLKQKLDSISGLPDLLLPSR